MHYNVDFHGSRKVIFHLLICVIFLIFAPNIDWGIFLRTALMRWVLQEFPIRSMFLSHHKKNIKKRP